MSEHSVEPLYSTEAEADQSLLVSSKSNTAPIDIANEAPVQETQGTVGFLPGYINLMKTILGSALMNFPYAFAKVGVFPAMVLMVFSATLSTFGLHLLIYAAHQVGRKSAFFNIAQRTYPKWAPLFDLIVALKCLAVGASYLISIGDLMPSVVKGIGGPDSSGIILDRILWISAIMVISGPISFLRKMDSLKYTSFFGLLSVIYMVILMVVDFASRNEPSKAPLFVPLNVSSFNVFGLFVFGFTCHQNIFPIHNEAKRNSVKQLTWLAIICMISASIVYTVVGFFGLATYGTDVMKNIFKSSAGLSMPDDKPAFIVARIMFVILLAFSYPLQVHPCRISTEKLLIAFGIAASEMERLKKHVHIFITLGIIIFTYALACIVDDLAAINAIVGSTTSVAMCYIIPFLYYLKLSTGELSKTKLYLSAAVAIFGILFAPFAITVFFIKTDK